jgi:hypothetical protein
MFGLQGAAIQEGIAKGMNQAGSALLNTSMIKKQIDSRDSMQRRLLAAKLGWAKGLQGPSVGPVKPMSGPAPAGAPGFEQQVGNFNLPAFAPAKDFGETSTPGPRLAGADLLARLED